MLIDFANDFADLLIPWTGTRPGIGADDDEGNHVPGVPTPLSFTATPVQPLNQNELKQQEGGEFVSSWVKAYSPFEVLINDVVTDNDVTYLVMQREPRNRLGGHHKFYCRAIQDDV